jgi:hypothetical protein
MWQENILKNFLMKTKYNKRFLFQSIIGIITALLIGQNCLGQKNVGIQISKDDESFLKLPDGVIKREIASFNIKASSSLNSFPKISVNELPLRFCKEYGAGFYKRGYRIFIHAENFDTTGHRFFYDETQKQHLILIDNSPYWGTNGEVPKRKIKNIVFEQMAFAMYLPDSAFKGLYEPNFIRKANGKKTTAYCKVFQSKDRKQLYIYMLNGYDSGSYEVTLVLRNGKYYTRVIDSR